MDCDEKPNNVNLGFYFDTQSYKDLKLQIEYKKKFNSPLHDKLIRMFPSFLVLYPSIHNYKFP